MAEFVKLQVPEELKKSQLDLLGRISKTGKIKIGLNECTKMVERGQAKLIVMAEDVMPPEIIMHLPLICKEKNIPFTYVEKKEELGKAVGIEVSTAAITVLDEGETKKEFSELLRKLKELK
ncbi:MAG: 50S ribosomal protein L7Ae [archaeon]